MNTAPHTKTTIKVRYMKHQEDHVVTVKVESTVAGNAARGYYGLATTTSGMKGENVTVESDCFSFPEAAERDAQTKAALAYVRFAFRVESPEIVH